MAFVKMANENKMSNIPIILDSKSKLLCFR